MLIFFLFISLINLATGYFVAVKFHNTLFPAPTRERELVRTSGEIVNGVPPFSIDASQMPLVNRQPPLVALPGEKINLPDVIPSAQAAISNPLPSIPKGPEPTQVDTAKAALSAEESFQRQFRNDSPENLTEVSVNDFMRGISDFRAQLSALDQRVRNCAKSPDTRQIEGCVQEFRAANSRYLEQTSEVKDRLEQAQPSASEVASNAREAMEQALALQLAEVRNTEGKLSQLNIAADPHGSCETLLNTAHALASSNDKLRDELELAKRNLQPESDIPSEEESISMLDELTQIPNRQMFDLEIRRQTKRGESFCIALADLDHCGQLNLSYGPAVTDEILKAIAKIVAASARGECRAARYSGQQFAVLFPNYQLAETALAVENIRQIIHLTEFKHDETRLNVSVSITLISSQANESLHSIEQRLSTGVATAKNNVRNKSYQFQAGKVEPISPPELDLQVNSYEV